MANRKNSRSKLKYIYPWPPVPGQKVMARKAFPFTEYESLFVGRSDLSRFAGKLYKSNKKSFNYYEATILRVHAAAENRHGLAVESYDLLFEDKRKKVFNTFVELEIVFPTSEALSTENNLFATKLAEDVKISFQQRSAAFALFYMDKMGGVFKDQVDHSGIEKNFAKVKAENAAGVAKHDRSIPKPEEVEKAIAAFDQFALQARASRGPQPWLEGHREAKAFAYSGGYKDARKARKAEAEAAAKQDEESPLSPSRSVMQDATKEEEEEEEAGSAALNQQKAFVIPTKTKTSQISKYKIGQLVQMCAPDGGFICGLVVAIQPKSAGAKEGPGYLMIQRDAGAEEKAADEEMERERRKEEEEAEQERKRQEVVERLEQARKLKEEVARKQEAEAAQNAKKGAEQATEQAAERTAEREEQARIRAAAQQKEEKLQLAHARKEAIAKQRARAEEESKRGLMPKRHTRTCRPLKDLAPPAVVRPKMLQAILANHEQFGDELSERVELLADHCGLQVFDSKNGEELDQWWWAEVGACELTPDGVRLQVAEVGSLVLEILPPHSDEEFEQLIRPWIDGVCTLNVLSAYGSAGRPRRMRLVIDYFGVQVFDMSASAAAAAAAAAAPVSALSMAAAHHSRSRLDATKAASNYDEYAFWSWHEDVHHISMVEPSPAAAKSLSEMPGANESGADLEHVVKVTTVHGGVFFLLPPVRWEDGMPASNAHVRSQEWATRGGASRPGSRAGGTGTDGADVGTFSAQALERVWTKMRANKRYAQLVAEHLMSPEGLLQPLWEPPTARAAAALAAAEAEIVAEAEAQAAAEAEAAAALARAEAADAARARDAAAAAAAEAAAMPPPPPDDAPDAPPMSGAGALGGAPPSGKDASAVGRGGSWLGARIAAFSGGGDAATPDAAAGKKKKPKKKRPSFMNSKRRKKSTVAGAGAPEAAATASLATEEAPAPADATAPDGAPPVATAGPAGKKKKTKTKRPSFMKQRRKKSTAVGAGASAPPPPSAAGDASQSTESTAAEAAPHLPLGASAGAGAATPAATGKPKQRRRKKSAAVTAGAGAPPPPPPS